MGIRSGVGWRRYKSREWKKEWNSTPSLQHFSKSHSFPVFTHLLWTSSSANPSILTHPCSYLSPLSGEMCREYVRHRWCQHNQEIWRPGPRTCRRARRENASRQSHRVYRCSQAYQTFTQQMNMPCKLRQCRISFKVANGFICCQCRWRDRAGQLQLHGPPERHVDWLIDWFIWLGLLNNLMMRPCLS